MKRIIFLMSFFWLLFSSQVFSQIDITFGCQNGNVGDVISIPVFASANGNVNPLVAFQGTIEFTNSNNIDFVDITSTIGVGFNNVNDTQTNFLWTSGQLAITNNTLLFNVNVLITEVGCTEISLNSSSILAEFYDNTGQVVDFSMTSCEICGESQVCDCIHGGEIYSNVNQCDATFSLSGFGVDGCASIVPTYTWNYGDSSVNEITTGNPFPIASDHTYSQNGTYTVTVSFDLQDNSTGELCNVSYTTEIVITDCDSCIDEPYIEPFWEFCDSYNVCELDYWPVHVLGADGDALLEIEGYTFLWSTGSTADHIFGVVASQEVTVQVTYPNGCVYNLTYIKECCTDIISVSFNECPKAEMLPILERKLATYIDGYAIPTRRELRTAINVYRDLTTEEYAQKKCDPCEAGWVTGNVLDNQGNPITNFDSITFTNNITGQMSTLSQNNFTARVDVPYTVTVVITDENGDTCTYTFDFIYECEEKCSEITVPTNLQQVGSTLTWDSVLGAVGYIVSSPFDINVVCKCEAQVSIIPIETSTNSVELPSSLHSKCFVWQVVAICEDGTKSEPTQACFTAIKSATSSAFEEVTIYPNPTKGEMTFEINTTYNGKVTIEVYNFYGYRIKTFEKQVDAQRINTVFWNGSNLEKGVYFVKFKTDKETIQKQIIIN